MRKKKTPPFPVCQIFPAFPKIENLTEFPPFIIFLLFSGHFHPNCIWGTRADPQTSHTSSPFTWRNVCLNGFTPGTFLGVCPYTCRGMGLRCRQARGSMSGQTRTLVKVKWCPGQGQGDNFVFAHFGPARDKTPTTCTASPLGVGVLQEGIGWGPGRTPPAVPHVPVTGERLSLAQFRLSQFCFFCTFVDNTLQYISFYWEIHLNLNNIIFKVFVCINYIWNPGFRPSSLFHLLLDCSQSVWPNLFPDAYENAGWNIGVPLFFLY